MLLRGQQALEANGRKVAENIQAFRWGRALVATPEIVDGVVSSTPEIGSDLEVVAREDTVATVMAALESEHRPADATADLAGFEELVDLVAVRMDEVQRWGSDKDARHYLDDVCTMYRQERRVRPGSVALTREFAIGLHKVSTYKDEYEVARLALDEGFATQVARDYGEDVAARLKVMLQPPLLRAMGLNRKIGLGKWSEPALRSLATMKRLRGTKLDIFGAAEVRVLERELKRQYRAVLLSQAKRMTSQERMAELIELAAAADGVRGFEEKKLNSGREMLAKLDAAGGVAV